MGVECGGVGRERGGEIEVVEVGVVGELGVWVWLLWHCLLLLLR